jgi:subtilisin-like proprotein convertase family protein
MMDTADKIDPAGGQWVDGHSPSYGHGRINAHNALMKVAGIGEERLPEVLFMEHRANTPIPDRGETEDAIPFPLEVLIKGIDVNIEIRHTWRGDLRVSLVSPQGQEIILENGTGGSRDDIIKDYRSSLEPDLFAPLIETAAKGEWRLKVVDMYRQDVGLIVKWGLAITY